MVFLTEGQSAAGSIVSCRDVNTQAIFVLKGKPLNVWDLKRDIVYKNDEMYNLMRSLDIEDNLENLRYEKVILATDADVDGLHIRNLLITYFFRFFDHLVHDGHLFVLETPLFRVRNKEKTTAPRNNWARIPKSHVLKVWAKSPRASSSSSSEKKCVSARSNTRPSRTPRASSVFIWARTRRSAKITSWKTWWWR
jgi:DNA gyrase/topoisomerase IV subunit B